MARSAERVAARRPPPSVAPHSRARTPGGPGQWGPLAQAPPAFALVGPAAAPATGAVQRVRGRAEDHRTPLIGERRKSFWSKLLTAGKAAIGMGSKAVTYLQSIFKVVVPAAVTTASTIASGVGAGISGMKGLWDSSARSWTRWTSSSRPSPR